MEAIRIQVQARRCQSKAVLGGALSTAPRLADVVRCAIKLSRQSVVLAIDRAPPGRRACSHRPAREKSFPRQASAPDTGSNLRLSLHRLVHAATDRRDLE